MSKCLKFSLMILGSVLLGNAASAAEPAAAATKCENFADIKSKSRQEFDSTVLLQVSGMLENQGPTSFDVAYEAPKSACEVESFDNAGSQVSIVRSPWKKGDATLLYRIVVKSPAEQREFLVVYDGIVSNVAKEDCFHVSEKRNGMVSWYAVFKDQPTYAAVKALVVGILTDDAKPLLAVKWSADSKDLQQVVYDHSRLK